MNFPERATVVRETAKNATRIRKAFNQAINGAAIAKAWVQTHPDGGTVTPQTARDWALAHSVTTKKPLELALSRLYADGYTLGSRVSKGRVLRMVTKNVSTGTVDWTRWVPGAESAAALVKPTGGLQELLRRRKVSITDDIMRTKLDRIGSSLAESLSRGADAFETAKGINAIINDPQHALMIARTEMARSMSVASRDVYETNNVQKVEWLVADGCDLCQDNADASPIGIDETFPSGDAEPPAHPNCECAIAPYFDDEDEQAPQEEIEIDEESIDSVESMDTYQEEIYRPVESDEQAMTVMNQQLAAGMPGKYDLDWDKAKAVNQYQKGDYSSINNFLRDPGVVGNKNNRNFIDPRQVPTLEKTISNLDEVIAQAPPLESPILTYRGVSGGEVSQALHALKAGDVFVEPAYMSTTLLPRIVEDSFIGRGGQSWVMTIENPAGTKGLFPAPFNSGPMNSGTFSGLDAEAEWLLPRGARLEVISITPADIGVIGQIRMRVVL